MISVIVATAVCCWVAELDGRRPELERLGALAGKGRLTLVLAARDPAHSSAAVLRERLLGEA